MSTPTFTGDSVVRLGDLDYDGAQALRAWCDRATNGDSPLWVAQKAKWAEEAKVSEARSKKRKAAEAAFEPKLNAWVRAHLAPGMRVKMRGTRDRDGIREVLEVHEHHIECRQVLVNRWTKSESKGTVTLHYYTKLSHLLSKNATWVRIRDCVEGKVKS